MSTVITDLRLNILNELGGSNQYITSEEAKCKG